MGPTWLFICQMGLDTKNQGLTALDKSEDERAVMEKW
jgi:hypothetical protein